MKKGSKIINYMLDDGKVGRLDENTYRYMKSLENQLHEKDLEKKRLEWELKSIKPVLEQGNLRPALNTACQTCRYVVKSTYNNDVLGCNKLCVCDDYAPEVNE